MSERTVTEHVRPSVAGTGLPPALGLVMTPARGGAPPGVVDLPRPVTTGSRLQRRQILLCTALDFSDQRGHGRSRPRIARTGG